MPKPFAARKSLGQHFLTDSSAVEKIIVAAEELAQQPVLEIGPGTGILTKALLASGAKVTAVEFDRRAFEYLRTEFSAEKNLKLISGDALKFDPQEYFGGGNYKIVSNLPYQITAPFFRHFWERTRARPQRAVVMIQKEVAHKISAENSALGLHLNIFCSIEKAFDLPPGAFSPPPKVHSSVVTLQLRERPLLEGANYQQFCRIVRRAFQFPRKKMSTIFKAEKDLLQRWEPIIDLNARPKTIDLSQWLELSAL